ncbi:MAG: hypothetical protein K6D03_12725 [Solobacterium sp.]|nr:hypothetical protein [Solobacterium sp.]
MNTPYQLIRDMPYRYNADIGLAYSSPCRGVWNIVHYGTLVPQGHQIFVCPTSCLRGVVLTTAEMGREAMKKLSTITVGEDNILNGDMEEQLLHGTEKIINTLHERPRMVMIFTSCIHHFMAVNYQRVYRILRKEYPDIDFIDCYMDPIMRRTAPPDPSLRRQVLRVLKPAEHDSHRVSFVGNCYPMTEYCDLYVHLKRNGIEVSDLTTMKKYDEFKLMEQSCLNFTFNNAAAMAGRDLSIRLKQPEMKMRPTYFYDDIDADMQNASETLQIPDVSDEEKARLRKETEEAALRLREKLNGVPVSVDYTAVVRPLEFAVYLLEHGFNVESVLIDVITESEEVFRKLVEIKPDLKVYSSLGWNMRTADRTHEGKILAVGQKSAYFNNTNYFVNVVENAGMYGYRGILHLLGLMEEAFDSEKNMPVLIQEKGWGCRV